MCVQVVRLQGLGHTEPVEHAANAVDAESPEWSFTVLGHEVLESAHLVGSSRMEAQLASLPACPGVGCHLEELRCLGLCQVTQGLSQVNQVQIRAARPHRSIRHV